MADQEVPHATFDTILILDFGSQYVRSPLMPHTLGRTQCINYPAIPMTHILILPPRRIS